MPDREKVIRDLETYRDRDFIREGKTVFDSDPRYRKMIINNAIAILKAQEWISVKDRLPNCNGCYIVWRPHFYHDKGMPSICYFDGSNTWHDSYGVDFSRLLAPEDVSHWKPLPEQPYKVVK